MKNNREVKCNTCGASKFSAEPDGLVCGNPAWGRVGCTGKMYTVAPRKPVLLTRSEMERGRMVHAIERLEAHIAGLRLALRHSLDGVPIGLEPGQAITQAAVEIATTLAKLDAYQRAESDAKP